MELNWTLSRVSLGSNIVKASENMSFRHFLYLFIPGYEKKSHCQIICRHLENLSHCQHKTPRQLTIKVLLVNHVF